jgi:competence protein ComEC
MAKMERHKIMASGKRKKGNKSGGLFTKLAALAVVIAAGVFAADYFDIFKFEEWKDFFTVQKETAAEGEVQVHFINVGQGDCSLILSGDTAILIDTGEKENGELICDYLEKYSVENIDCMLLTHPHSDHMGAASYVIDNTDVEKVIIPKVSDDLTPTSKVYENLLKSVKNKGLKLTAAEPGMKIDAGEGELEIISPVNDYDDLNNYSAAAILTHGGNKFLFTGDIEKKAEKDIIETGALTDIDVLKVAHHGSNTSSSKEFLDIVKPEYAVIMCGDNSYKHPHEDTVNRLLDYTDKIYRTDMDGNIVITSTDKGFDIVTENGD